MNKWGLISVVAILGFLVIGANTRFAPTGHFKQKVGVNLVFTRSSELSSNVSPLDANSGLKPANVNVKIEKDYGKMPLFFIPNHGQMDKKVYYYVQGKDKSVYFTSEGITYDLAVGNWLLALRRELSSTVFDNERKLKESSQPSPRWVVKLDFVGARKEVKPECLEQSGTVVSYFRGKPAEWKAGLQAASKIIYRELWPGIDLVYYGTVNRMKKEC